VVSPLSHRDVPDVGDHDFFGHLRWAVQYNVFITPSANKKHAFIFIINLVDVNDSVNMKRNFVNKSITGNTRLRNTLRKMSIYFTQLGNNQNNTYL
jgi:hypothetical protein